MEIIAFLIQITAAAGMGIAIGIERQQGHHTAGLRTNALVAFGACLYVSLPRLLGENATSAHLAGQVVVGVGFMGGGVILHEGLNVRGLNTAATMWCSAAVGALAGAGLLLEGAAATVGVLAINVALRPVGEWLDRRGGTARAPTTYHLRADCAIEQEAVVQEVVLRFVRDHPGMRVQRSTIQDGSELGEASVIADIYAERRSDEVMAELAAMLRRDQRVKSASIETNPAS